MRCAPARTAPAKQNAACALLSLSGIEENRATIGACGAIPLLVALLYAGSTGGKKVHSPALPVPSTRHAAQTLFSRSMLKSF
jgi:hypothetical protein